MTNCISIMGFWIIKISRCLLSKWIRTFELVTYVNIYIAFFKKFILKLLTKQQDIRTIFNEPKSPQYFYHLLPYLFKINSSKISFREAVRSMYKLEYYLRKLSKSPL